MSQEDVTSESEVIETQIEEQTENAEISVAELHQEVAPEKPKVTSVPFKTFEKEKEKRKELERKLAELQAQIGDDGEVEDEPEVKKLAQKLELIEEESKRDKLNRIFTENFNKVLENSPEYKDVVNPEVIKALAFNPANANKTYRQLFEEAYGNALSGRRTIETTTPRGGVKDTKVDMERARNDAEYRREVLATPELKKQYNESLTDRIFR